MKKIIEILQAIYEAIGIPGTEKSIVLEANDIETFKQSLVK